MYRQDWLKRYRLCVLQLVCVDVFSQNTLMEGPLTYTKLQQMTYLPKVVSETLRLFPGMIKHFIKNSRG